MPPGVGDEQRVCPRREGEEYPPFDPASMKAIRMDYAANELLLKDGERPPPINILIAS